MHHVSAVLRDVLLALNEREAYYLKNGRFYNGTSTEDVSEEVSEELQERSEGSQKESPEP